MNSKTFLMLAGATAIGVAGAIIGVVVESQTAGDRLAFDEPMFPELVARANEAGVVRFRSATEEATVILDGDTWRFVERNGYPVPSGNVRTVVAGIASLRRFEAKTNNPEFHARLGVEDIGTPDAFSREVIIETAGGDELAAVILGDISNLMAFDPLGGMYIREPGDPQSWLVRGNVALPPSAADWMERQIVHIPGPDIQKVVIREGPDTVLTAEKQQDEDLIRYHMVPEMEGVQAADSAWKQVASGTVSVTFEDVRPIGEIAGAEATRVVEYTTAEGLVLTLTAHTIEEEVWTTFAAAAAPESESVAKAAEINATAAEWAYRLPGYKNRAIHRDLADLTEPLPEEAPAEPGPGLPGGGLPPGLQLAPGAAIPEGLPLPPGFQLPAPAPAGGAGGR